MERVERRKIGPERLLVVVALNYGGRQEIVNAARCLAERVAAGDLSAAAISESDFGDELLTAGIPDPDLVVRTAGEKRLSNFLLWQTAYSEFVFLDCLWPDFGKAPMLTALAEYARRERRFGDVSVP